jgi:hypothetical protein
MDIVGSTEFFFFSLVDFFGSASAMKNEKELNAFIAQKEDLWQTVLSSGLIVENAKNPLNRTYHFDKAFQPVIDYLLAQSKAACQEVETVVKQPCAPESLSSMSDSSRPIIQLTVPIDSRTKIEIRISKCVLNPVKREQGILKVSPGFNLFKKGDACMVVAKSAASAFSFVLTLLNIEETPNLPLPVLVVDNRKTGPLSMNDIIEIVKIDPSPAEKINIGIDQSHKAITPGNWTKTLNPNLNGKVFDLGDKLSTAITMGAGMIIIKGMILNTIPRAPVIIVPTTLIEVMKYPDSELNVKQTQIDEEKKKRAGVITFLSSKT